MILTRNEFKLTDFNNYLMIKIYYHPNTSVKYTRHNSTWLTNGNKLQPTSTKYSFFSNFKV